MADVRSKLGWWISGLVILFFVVTWLFWPLLDDESSTREQTTGLNEENRLLGSVRILNWDWRRDRSGSVLVVYGVIQNQGDRDLKDVVLEFRAQDADGNLTGAATITVENLGAGQKKPFRQDLPPTGKEVMAFLEVRKASPK